MAYALGFLGVLAFAGWVLWLRERRIETVRDRLASYEASHRAALDEFHSATATANSNAESLQRSVNDVKAVKDGLSRMELRLGMASRGAAPDPVFAVPTDAKR